jgi:hypothetical protein
VLLVRNPWFLLIFFHLLIFAAIDTWVLLRVWEYSNDPRWQATVLTIVPMLYTNFEQIQDAFAAERPANTVERGVTAWRKVGYDAPGVKMRVSLQPGTRVVWLLNPRTAFPGLMKQNFSFTAAGPMHYTDLPSESGARLQGEYEIAG